MLASGVANGGGHWNSAERDNEASTNMKAGVAVLTTVVRGGRVAKRGIGSGRAKTALCSLRELLQTISRMKQHCDPRIKTA
jgi:hypothetical protein